MTKDEVILIVKRFPYIDKAIENERSRAKFYIGNRKQEIEITDNVITVKELVVLLYETEEDKWLKLLIKGLMTEKRDIQIMQEIHFSKSAYYPKKEAFIQKVYECCIAKGLVTFEEILKEK